MREESKREGEETRGTYDKTSNGKVAEQKTNAVQMCDAPEENEEERKAKGGMPND